MLPCESTLGFIDLAPSDTDKEHSSQSPSLGAVGGIIDLIRSDLEGEHAPLYDELQGMEEEDSEEHKVVEESIESARHGEEEVHHVVEDSFESLRENRLRAWLRDKNKGMKAAACPQFPIRRFDAICEIWLTAAARHKAVSEARSVASTPGFTNPFIGEGATSDGEDTSTSFGSSEGAAHDGADASSTYGSIEGTVDDMIGVSSRDE
jgi:hypothetical protein